MVQDEVWLSGLSNELLFHIMLPYLIIIEPLRLIDSSYFIFVAFTPISSSYFCTNCRYMDNEQEGLDF